MPIDALVAATGVTSRTLRHYEAIGLLMPTGHGAGGVRQYDQASVLRLQQILVLRELGLPLKQIAAVVNGSLSPETALADQVNALDAQIVRLKRMRTAVSKTQERLRNGEEMVANESFDGFEANPHAQEAQQRWPDNFAESQKRMAKLTVPEQREIFAQHGLIAVALTALMLEGKEPHSPEVQEQIDNHYRWICNFWTPDQTAYIALGQMYVDDERFKANYEGFAEGLAEFIRRGILHYAASRLG